MIKSSESVSIARYNLQNVKRESLLSQNWTASEEEDMNASSNTEKENTNMLFFDHEMIKISINTELNAWISAHEADDIIVFIKYICQQHDIKIKIDNEIYLYKMLITNLLQAMLVKRAEQSHQHQQSSNNALLTCWIHTQLKSETITTQSLTCWSLHIHRKTAMSLHTCCNLHTTYTYILQRHDSAFAHIQTDMMQ